MELCFFFCTIPLPHLLQRIMMSVCVKKDFGIHLNNLCNINHMNTNVQLKSPGQPIGLCYSIVEKSAQWEKISVSTRYFSTTNVVCSFLYWFTCSSKIKVTYGNWCQLGINSYEWEIYSQLHQKLQGQSLWLSLKSNVCVSHHVCTDSAVQLPLTQQPTEPSEWLSCGCVLDRGHHSIHLYHCCATEGHTLQRHKWDIMRKLN